MMKRKTLRIKWQRLVEKGETCPRCGSTEKELTKAIRILREKGSRVILQKTRLSLKNFAKDPSGSNCIYINGRLLEELINAKTGKSPCCDVCGEVECRTVNIGSREFETIPSDLIVKGALAALLI